MRTAVLLLALFGLTLAAEIETEENVLVLTNDNFQQALEENQYMLVEFYAPWCGHCKALAPQYAAAATALAEENSEIKLAKVDATEESELAQSFGVQGYPTIKFFKNGNPMDYSGGRTSDEIILWLKKKTGPPAEALPTPEDANAFIEKNEVAVIGFFEDAESEAAKEFTAAADAEDTLSFGITTSKEVAEALETTLDSIVLFKKFDEGRAVFSGDYTTEDILDFVHGEQMPLLTTFSDETAPKIFGGTINTHLLAFFSSEAEDAETLSTALRAVAAEVKGKVLFVHIDISREESDRITEFFQITEDDAPTARIITMGADMKKFVPEFSEITADNLRPWVADFLDGKLKAHLNSEDIPDNWDEEGVKVLVGKNFQEVALDTTKDVFVEFYAPWCGHCKQLAPIWEQLAEHFKDDENVVIAKMDSTKNEVEEVTIQGFPTLKFFRRETNEIVDYNGGRTLDDLTKWVEAQVEGKGDEGEEEEEEEEPEEEAVPIEGEENVLVLTKENFQQAVNENQYLLVEFYAPWCGHCKALAPHYAAAATALAEENSEIKLAKVDATEESKLAEKFEVQGFPTLLFFKSGSPIEYSGGRTSEAIILWLKKKTGPPAEALPTPEDANAFIEKYEVAVIGFFEDAESEAAKEFTAVADAEDALFGITTSKEVAEALETTLDSIVLFKKFDEGRAVFSGDFIAENIVDFVHTEQTPLLSKYSQETVQKVFGGAVQSFLLAFYSSESEDAETLGTTLRTVAAEVKGKVLFVHVDLSEEDSKRLMEFFQATNNEVPTVRIYSPDQNTNARKFVPEFSELTADNIRNFIQEYLDGNLKPRLNSEELPDNWDEEDVKVLVGKNFHEVALDTTKDVFVEFYAPWCGHCQQLAPIWEQLAEHFRDDENVVIAEMDSTRNEVEDVSVKGFPTLKFFRRGTNEIVDYDGGRTLDELIKWVEAQVEGKGDEGEEEEEGEEPEEEAVPIEGEENVLVLTKENFQQALEENQYLMVEFYAPWCKYCKDLAPEYAAAATALTEENSPIKLAKMDATEERELAENFGAHGYPTIMFFRDGDRTEYNGGRTSSDILLWLKKKTVSPTDTLLTPEDANAFIEKTEVAVIGFFEDAESEAAKEFTAAADAEDMLSFGITTSKEVAEALETTLDSIVLFKKFDEGRAVFSGDFTKEDILDFVHREEMPLLTTFSDNVSMKIFRGTITTHLMAAYSSESEDAETLGTTLRAVAAEFKGKMLFVHIDMSLEDSPSIAQFFQITEDDLPTARIVTMAGQDMKKFVPEFSELTADNLRPWIADFLDGKLKAHLNSEDIPDNWNEEAVKVLVGKNFQEVALDTTKDVFVEFYAPWCGHCKALAPIWEQLAEHFKDDENIVFAKMDATKNEVEDVSVQGFPTLKFFRRETNEIVDCNSGRTLDELIKWVEGHADGKSVEEEEEEEEEGEGEGPEEEAVPIEGEENVLVLTKENFQQALEENKYLMVEFYAPWCGHCKALAPHYAAAATSLAKENSEIKLAKVDATEESELAAEFEVKGFPTLKFFKRGNPIHYRGGRTSDEIILWLKKKTGPPAEALPTPEDANAFIEKNEVAVIGFFEDAESEAAKEFTTVADSEDALSFGITTSKEVAEALETTLDSIVLFKKFDEGRAVFSGDFTKEDILDFVLMEQRPLLSKYSMKTASEIFRGAMHTFLLALYSSESEDAETLGTTLRTVAAEVKEKVPFVHIDTSQEDSKGMTEFFGIADAAVPTTRIVSLGDNINKFVPEFSDLTEGNIRNFIQEYLDGKLTAHLNSEELPDNWNEEAVKVLVGQNFQEVALDTTKDVFVEFYSPLCHYCVELAPIWEELGEHFKDSEKIVIAKIDATKNEFEDFAVNAFPTLRFFRQETNEIIEYTGDRTLDELIKWVEAHMDGKSDEGEEEEEEEEEGGAEPGHEHTEL